MPIVDVIELKTAEELFAELSPASGRLWRVRDRLEPRDWLFRGQANGEDGAIWTLKPSAHRVRDAFMPFLLGQAEPRDLRGEDLRVEETRCVMAFATRVDFHGYIVPSDSHDLRDPRVETTVPAKTPTLFPPPWVVAIFGLAQHHGVPTRLLDWTWKPLVAAYFAAEEVARRRTPGRKPAATEAPYFSVFALRRDVGHLTRSRNPEVHLLTVPTATNANLHAQGGQFTLIQPTLDPGDAPLPAIDEVLREHEQDLLAQFGPWASPLLVEFRVPVKEARTTMVVLHNMGVNAASVFPGLDGVARSLREARMYQWAKPADRS